MNAEQMFKKLEDEEEATSKYISLEELDAINIQIAELGWRPIDSDGFLKRPNQKKARKE